MSTMRLSLYGQREGITLDALAVAARGLLGILSDVDVAISGEPRGSLDWVVSDLAVGSIVVQVKSYSRLNNSDFGTDVVRESIRGLYILETEGLTPPYLSDGGIKSAKQLVKLIGNKGVHGIGITNHTEQVDLTARASASIDQLVRVGYRSIGSVEGKLEMISIHRQPQFTVYHHRTHKAVRCQFTPDLLEQVKDALGQRVIAIGEVSWNAKGEPMRVKIEHLRRLRSADKLPTSDMLRGSDPDYTGDWESAAYVRGMRDG